MVKICKACDKEQPISNFYLRGKGRPGQYESYCKPCKNSMKRQYAKQEDRSVRQERIYGIDLKFFLDLQDSKCGICQDPLPDKFCVDHDHITGEVRGLLCYNCNTAIGKLKERASLLRRAALWVEEGGIGGIGERERLQRLTS